MKLKASGKEAPAEQKKSEPSYLMETEDGLMINVPESRLEDWTKAQKSGSKLPDSIRQRLIDDLYQEITGQKK
jgi:hypothetical protein